VETGVTTTGTSGRERGSSGAGAMMGSGLITELVGCDGVVMVSLSGVEAVVGVKSVAPPQIRSTCIAFVGIDVRKKTLKRNSHFTLRSYPTRRARRHKAHN
jgi:hypothetical protein